MNFLKPGSKVTIAQGFSDSHKAIDWAGRYGSWLVAPEDGTITIVITPDTFDGTTEDLFKGYGIRMKGVSGIEHVYWHCLPFFPVGVGQMVRVGQPIAQMGNSGFVLSFGQIVPLEVRTKSPYPGTHCHQEMVQGGTFLNPLEHIDLTLPVEIPIEMRLKSIATVLKHILKVV